MVKFHELEFGSTVEITAGQWAGVKGIVVSGNHNNSIGISVSDCPELSRANIYTDPANLRLVSRDDPYGLRAGVRWNRFDQARESLALQEPWTILTNPDLQTPRALQTAQEMLEDILTKPHLYATETVARARQYRETGE